MLWLQKTTSCATVSKRSSSRLKLTELKIKLRYNSQFELRLGLLSLRNQITGLCLQMSLKEHLMPWNHVTALSSTTPVNVQTVSTLCTSAKHNVLQKSTVIWRLTVEGGRFVRQMLTLWIAVKEYHYSLLDDQLLASHGCQSVRPTVCLSVTLCIMIHPIHVQQKCPKKGMGSSLISRIYWTLHTAALSTEVSQCSPDAHGTGSEGWAPQKLAIFLSVPLL